MPGIKSIVVFGALFLLLCNIEALSGDNDNFVKKTAVMELNHIMGSQKKGGQ